MRAKFIPSRVQVTHVIDGEYKTGFLRGSIPSYETVQMNLSALLVRVPYVSKLRDISGNIGGIWKAGMELRRSGFRNGHESIRRES